MTIATPTPIDAEKRLRELDGQNEERQQREKAREDAQRDSVRKKLLAGRKVGGDEIPIALEIQRDEILPAAEKAVVKAKRTEDTGAFVSLGDRVLEPTDRLRKTADSFVEALIEVKPLLRQFANEARALGITLPPAFTTGAMIEWELAATLYRAWPRLFTRPRTQQLHKNHVGELIERSVATAVEAARRTLNEERE